MNGLTEGEARALKTPVPQCDHYIVFVQLSALIAIASPPFVHRGALRKRRYLEGPFCAVAEEN